MSTAKEDFHSATVFSFLEIFTSELRNILSYILPYGWCEQCRITAQCQGAQEHPTGNRKKKG